MHERVELCRYSQRKFQKFPLQIKSQIPHFYNLACQADEPAKFQTICTSEKFSGICLNQDD